MSNWGSHQQQSQQQSKTNVFQQKPSSSFNSASSKSQWGLSDSTQGQNQSNMSWNAPTTPQQYQQYSARPYPPGVVNTRQTPSEDVTKTKYNADARADIYRQAKNSIGERERDDQMKRFDDLGTAPYQSGRDGSITHEGKQEDRVQYGSLGQEVPPGKQHENSGDVGSALKVSNAATSRQSGTSIHGWQHKDPTKLTVNNAASHTTYLEPSANVSKQLDTIPSRGDQNDLTKQSILHATTKSSTISSNTDSFAPRRVQQDPRQNELTSHAVIHNLSSKTHTETDKFIPDGKPKDPRQHIAHTAVPKPSTEISTEDTSSPDWERRDPKQPEFTSYPAFPKPPTQTSGRLETLDSGRERKDARKRLSDLQGMTPRLSQVDNIPSDSEGEGPKHQEHAEVFKPSIDDSTQADSVVPTRRDSGMPEITHNQTLTPPPSLRTSFISGRKKMTFGKFFSKRQDKASNETPLSEKTFAKPGQSATTSVSLEVKDLSEDQVIIAIMGPTGSGKSSFIGTATKSNVGVGHALQSCTTEINMVKLNWVDSYETTDFDIVFVDTPGFDDTNKSDVEILEMLADWLHKTYENHITLAGILYFHRISDNRMAGTPLKNLRMFRELCGKKALENIILVTTMWDEVEEHVGADREKELRGKYWKAMIDQGSATARYHGTSESAWDIVQHFTTQRQAVLLQKEMVDLKKQLPETSAGQELYMALEVLVRKQADILQKIRAETKRQETGQDPRILQALQAECEAIRQQLHTTMKEMQGLKLPLGKRLSRLVWTPIGFKSR